MTVDTETSPLTPDELRKMHAYWRAANYLAVGQIYLYDNPLLKQPLTRDHIKPRLLGHWGTTPGLNFIYVHLNRIIKKHDLSILYVDRTGTRRSGPGRQHLSGRHLQRDLSADLTGRRRDEAALHAVLVSVRESRVTSHRKRPDRSTKAASWATPCRTPTAPRSTIPICSWRASSATARPRPDRWPRAGIRTSSSIRPATVRSFRSCI